MILILCAVSQEPAHLRKRISFRPAGHRAWVGAIGGQPVRLCIAGVGIQAARRLQQELVQHPIRCVIMAGFAGGLDPALKVGDVIIDPGSVNLRMPGHHAFHVERQAFHTVEEVAATVEAKARLWQGTGRRAVEMEWSYISEACRERNVPAMSIRAICDSADQEIPIPFALSYDLQHQCARPLAVMAYLSTRPSLWGAFRRFLDGLDTASRRLADALAVCVPAAASGGIPSQP